MEVDEPTQESAQTSLKKSGPKLQVHLRDDDPFELDSIIGPYTGRRKIERLLFVARSCPQLRVEAYDAALRAIEQSSLDYRLYLEILGECKEATGDEKWAEDARVKQENGLEKLDVELKNYQNNLIKESIRMGYRDIGDFQAKSGDSTAAVRAYVKSRDYCTTSQHILDMCLSVIDTALNQDSYATVRNHVVKAEAALAALTGAAKPAGEASSGGAGRGTSLPGMLTSNQPGKREEEARLKHLQLVGEKLAIADAVAALGQASYEKAARLFLNASPASAVIAIPSQSSRRDPASVSTAAYISPGDIGVFGVLCGMATLDRAQFKRMVVDNASFRPYLEHTPFLKSLVLAYHNSRFLEAIQLIEQHKARLLLTCHLSPQVLPLIERIKDKMLIRYFEPFKSVKIERMAAAFGITATELEPLVVKLIKDDKMKARVDKREQTIVAHTPHARDVVYEHALKVSQDNDRSSRALTFRMKLIQADLIVDVKKNSTAPAPQQQQQQQQQGQQTAKTKGASIGTRSGKAAQDNAVAVPEANVVDGEEMVAESA